MKHLLTRGNNIALTSILFLFFNFLTIFELTATTYTFTGVGDWNVSGNWDANGIPPSTLLNGDAVIINYTDRCKLTTNLVLEEGSSLTSNSNNWDVGTYTITNSGTITISGSVNSDNFNFINNNSGLIITTGAVFVNGTLTNAGNIHGNNGFWALSSNSHTNTGTIQLNNNCSLDLSPGGSFDNSGFFQLNDNSSALNEGTFTNNGTLQINSEFQNGFWDPFVSLINNGIIEGTGTIEQNGTFTNSSTGSISSGASPGKLTINGNFDFGSGIFTCEIDGTDQGVSYDWLSVSGTATIAGDSRLDIVFGYTPLAGTTFDIVTAASVSGTFTYPANVTFSGGNVGAIALSYPGGDRVRVEVAALLPVELVSFEAKAESNIALLKWETASEQNNRGFEIQRSSNGNDWKMLGFVAGSGTSTENRQYVFLDEKPLTGANYYRLRQMDFDNGEKYSRVRTVQLKQVNGFLSLSPNPATAKTRLTFDADEAGEAALTIYDVSGKPLKAQTVALNAGKNQLDIELPDLPGGTYWVKITAGDGQWYQRLMVK
jgi:hypothetical protein